MGTFRLATYSIGCLEQLYNITVNLTAYLVESVVVNFELLGFQFFHEFVGNFVAEPLLDLSLSQSRGFFPSCPSDQHQRQRLCETLGTLTALRGDHGSMLLVEASALSNLLEGHGDCFK